MRKRQQKKGVVETYSEISHMYQCYRSAVAITRHQLMLGSNIEGIQYPEKVGNNHIQAVDHT